MLNLFKTIFKVEDDLDLECDTVLLNSRKYADSNSDTDALEKLLKAIRLEDSAPTIVKNLSDALLLVKNSDSKTNNDKIDEESHLLDNGLGNKFTDRLSSQLKLLEELEGENANILPGQPVYQPARFGKEGGNNFVLRRFPIPDIIYEAMKTNCIDMLDLNKQMTTDNYIRRFQTLLWVEEAHQAIEMRRYDLFDMLLARHDEDFFMLHVPGLAEGRPSLMRGDRLILQSHKRSSSYEGYIYQVREREVIIKLHESLHFSALDGLRFDVSFLTSRTSFRRCHHGVVQYRGSLNKETVFPLPKQQWDLQKPLTDITDTNYEELRCFMRCLNIYQRRAVVNVLKATCRPAPYIIFGPPGTGKTVTMVEAVLQVYARKKGSKILVCGNSNACADILATRIKESGVVPKDNMVRVSAFYRMEKLIPPELEDITKDMDMITTDMFENYRIVITTCIQSGSLYEFKDRFDYVFIDEAGHANEPEALISIGLMKRFGCCVLAGDPYQLGPVCISNVANEHGLGTSLLERLSRRTVYQRQLKDYKMAYDEHYITKLIICYRSDFRVLAVSNELFYHNELKFENNTPEFWMEVLKITHPIVFHPVRGRDRRERVNPSWFNPNEAITCLSYVTRLYGAGLKANQLGIITPYRRQIDKLNLLFESCKLEKCKIATMEEFQGDEREIIIISTVRTREKNIEFDRKFNLGFLFDPKRFNVAVSRAKWLAIVIGEPKILSRDKCWSKFMERAHKIETNYSQAEPQAKSN